MNDLYKKIKAKTWMDLSVISNIVQLLMNEILSHSLLVTVKKWQNETDEQLRDFNEIYTYTKNLKLERGCTRLIDENDYLLRAKKEILEADTLARVEDLYRTVQGKRKTQRPTIAKAND